MPWGPGVTYGSAAMDSGAIAPPDAGAVQARLDAALAAADEAGAIAMESFQSPTLDVKFKSDGSVVTPADSQAERAIRTLIESSFPEDSILGEEHADRVGTSGFRWIVDPIDGTRSYARGVPTWAVLIGVEFGHSCVAGVVDLPAIGERVHASVGHGAWWATARGDVREARVSGCSKLAEAYVETIPPRAHADAGYWGMYELLTRKSKRVQGWSDALSFAMVATGRRDAAVDFGFSLWDIAPFQPIVEEAGGMMCDWSGMRNLHAATTLVSTKGLRDELLEIVKDHT